MTKYCEVAVNFPLKDSLLTYELPEGEWDIGDLVKVPLGKRQEKGVIVSFDARPDPKFKTKEISQKMDWLKINPKELSFYTWVSKYYHYSLGKLIFDILPKELKRPRPLKPLLGQGQPLEFAPNDFQKNAIDKISNDFSKGFSKSLVHGVTGSGKTLIYLELMKKITEQKKSVLFLLPEINLTPQFLKTFEKHLNVKIYKYHSAITNSEKFKLWQVLNDAKEPALIVGVRSSIFLPVKNLGMVIVDEEHDQSFKQSDRCPYNARDVAIKRCHDEKIPIVLGSATPSTETLYSCTRPGQNYFKTLERVDNASMPKIEIVDGKTGDPNEQLLTPEVELKIKNALDKGEQVLVFLNRLGHSSFILCHGCGHQFMCPNCDIPLKYFQKTNTLRCSHCGCTDKKPEACPECFNLKLNYYGAGTEKVCGYLQKLLPEKRVQIFDRDNAKNLDEVEAILDKFHDGELDILVGTQMLSKGHNFKRVNLVVILGIDSYLNYPDFRANERVFQLVTQVAGRSGRYATHGEVVIQSMTPESEIFDYIQKNDVDGFYKSELELREGLTLSPYSKMAMIYLTFKDKNILTNYAHSVVEAMEKIQEKDFPSVTIMGPVPSFIERRVNQFTWMIMVKSTKINELHNLISTFETNMKPKQNIQVKIDIDPYTLM